MQDFNWQKLQNGSDIRGVAIAGVPNEPVNLTPDIAKLLGQAFATWLAQKLDKPTTDLLISVGRDSRLSGAELMQAVMEGINSLGSDVYDFAIASTPAMFMSTITDGFNCDGAIMLTASHLPFNRNGLKFFTAQGGLEKKILPIFLILLNKINLTLLRRLKARSQIMILSQSMPINLSVKFGLRSIILNIMNSHSRA